MAKQIKEIDYDSDNDILFISNGEKIKASVDIGDFVLDINHNNLVCGIEIMDASENLGVSEEVLENIRSIKMSVVYKTNHAYVLLMMAFKKADKDVNIQIPLTINLGHRMPRKEVSVYN